MTEETTMPQFENYDYGFSDDVEPVFSTAGA